MRVHVKTGVKADGTITANEMHVLSDTGTYGSHDDGGRQHRSQAMALYVGDGPYRQAPNIRFTAEVVYTNTAPSGAFRGYGVPRALPVERQMEQLATHLGLDPLAFRLKNALREGELHPFSTAWSEGHTPQPEYIRTCGLAECARVGGGVDRVGEPGWGGPRG